MLRLPRQQYFYLSSGLWHQLLQIRTISFSPPLDAFKVSEKIQSLAKTNLEEAVLFTQSNAVDVVNYNVLIKAVLDQKQGRLALELYQDVRCACSVLAGSHCGNR